LSVAGILQNFLALITLMHSAYAAYSTIYTADAYTVAQDNKLSEMINQNFSGGTPC
jgi:hypothetical protein